MVQRIHVLDTVSYMDTGHLKTSGKEKVAASTSNACHPKPEPMHVLPSSKRDGCSHFWEREAGSRVRSF